MLKNIYKGGLLLATLLLASCAADESVQNLTPGDIPITLSGSLSRATGDNMGPLTGYTNLKLTAKVTPSGGSEINYFINKDVTVGAALSGDHANENELESSVYYPLSDNSLRLYSHTGEIVDGNLKLKSSKASSDTDLSNDILISNGDDGKGTPGSSNQNATLLTYRHVMTKLEVVVENAENIVATAPKSISFKVGTFASKEGKYALNTAKGTTNDKAFDANGEYEITKDTHYLVPNGNDLTGQALTYLKIDDYIATAADLASLKLPSVKNDAGTTSNLVLSPGLAYKLIFKVNRLKEVSIELKMENWDIKTGDGSWGYEPYKVTMDVDGGYDNKDGSLINKVVLKYKSGDDTYQYIGGVTDGALNFVTLPTISETSAEMEADLYTANGLLIQNHPITYTRGSEEKTGSFSMSLGKLGMAQDAGAYQVTTPLQFYNLMTAATSDIGTATYKLTADMDLDGLPAPDKLAPMKEFPTGAILDGNGHSILHLNMAANGLITTNKGTISNLSISTGTFTTSGTYAGGICSVNEGTIEGCMNNADLKGNATILGGICGSNTGTGTITACVNAGNIVVGTTVGGICGENTNTEASALLACINAGTLNKSATNLGGVMGTTTTTSTKQLADNCFWLTGTARKAQDTSDEKAVGNVDLSSQTTYCNNCADLAPERLRSSIETTGGITMLNDALISASKNWKFKWEVTTDENATGTYTSVWPWPVKTN